MEINTCTAVEEAARDAICAVVDVECCERLLPGHVATPDWRMTLGDGRVADVEVTRCIDQATTELFAAAHTRDGSPKKRHNAKLSYQWVVTVADRDPAFNKKRRPLKQVADIAISILAKVEAVGGTPEQMAQNASVLFDGWGVAYRGSEETITHLRVDGLQIQDGGRSQLLAVGYRTPEWVGPGEGSVELTTITTNSSSGKAKLVSDVQDAIDRKTKKQQMDASDGLKWLAVIVEGLAAFQLQDYYGPGSRYYDHDKMQHPVLGGISFDYFDDVWISSWRGGVVLLLSNGGTEMMVHHL